jgi:hypothetical protein
MTTYRRPTRRNLRAVRRRYRVDAALMTGDTAALHAAAVDYFRARTKKLTGDAQRHAALALIALADEHAHDREIPADQ